MDEALELQIRAEQERERVEREAARGRVEGEHNARREEADKWRQRVDEADDRHIYTNFFQYESRSALHFLF